MGSIGVKNWEYYSASIIWYTTYVYILMVACWELNNDYKDRFSQRRLMRPSYLPLWVQNLKFDLSGKTFLPFKFRDHMEQEWQMYLLAAPVCFIGVPLSYIIIDYIFSRSPGMTNALRRNLMIGYSLFTSALLLSPIGLAIVLTITVLYYLFGRMGSKTLIWLSAFVLTTISNSRADLFMDFVSDDLSRHQKYLIEFIVVTQMFRIVSFSLTLCDQTEKDSLLDLIEYNFYSPLLCGPWCIYPIYRKDRTIRGNNEPIWTVWKLFRKFFSIFQMYIFIELYLHIFPFTCVAHDNHTRRNLSLTALAGVVLAAVQHFSNKYTVLYGIPASISTSIGFYCPPGPHNVSTRSTFRDMWQLFDKGLHLFLKNFIYIPTITATFPIINYPVFKRLLASVLCYFTVYYWHGASTTCFWWAVTNWLGIVIEQHFNILTSQMVGRSFWTDRAILGTRAILFGFLINSNLIYLFQSDVTYQIVKRLYFEKFSFCATAHIVLYCGVIAIDQNHIPTNQHKIKID